MHDATPINDYVVDYPCSGSHLSCYSDISFRNNNEISLDGFFIFFKQAFQYSYFVCWPLIFKTQKYHTFMRLILSKNKLTKIFVICYQYAILFEGFLDNISIIRSPDFVKYRNYIMILQAQSMCNRRPCAFIHKEPHLTSLCGQRHKCGVFKGFCCKQ
jgi:hypothetical protein